VSHPNVLELPCVMQQDVELPEGCQLMRHRYGTKDDALFLLIVGGNRERMVKVRIFLYYQVDGPRFIRFNLQGKPYVLIA
jgi:hypothetical protein